jgi:hypothetical protein
MEHSSSSSSSSGQLPSGSPGSLSGSGSYHSPHAQGYHSSSTPSTDRAGLSSSRARSQDGEELSTLTSLDDGLALPSASSSTTSSEDFDDPSERSHAGERSQEDDIEQSGEEKIPQLPLYERIAKNEEQLKQDPENIFLRTELQALRYEKRLVEQDIATIRENPTPVQAAIAAASVELPPRVMIADKKQLHEILNKRKGAVLFYTGTDLTNSDVTTYMRKTQERPIAAFMFGDNGNRAGNLEEHLETQAKKLLRSDATPEKLAKHVKKLRLNIDTVNSPVMEVEHKGKGQAEILKDRDYKRYGRRLKQHYYPTTLGVVTCDPRGKSDTEKAEWMKRQITETFALAKSMIAEYGANIVVPMDAKTRFTSMGTGRAQLPGRQPEGFKDAEVIEFIDQQIDELSRFSLKQQAELSESASRSKSETSEGRPSSPEAKLRKSKSRDEDLHQTPTHSERRHSSRTSLQRTPSQRH